MKYFSILGEFRNTAKNLRSGPHAPQAGRFGGSAFGRFWAAISYPFHRSIYIRFQYTFGLAIFGLTLLAAITFASGNILLNTFEKSVSEARFVMIPIHHLQESLNEADRLAHLYVIEHDGSAVDKFRALQSKMESELAEVAQIGERFASEEHAHAHISVPDMLIAARAAQSAVLDVFQHASRTPEATQALLRALKALNSVDIVAHDFNRLAMQDLQGHLHYAHSLADWTFFSVVCAILVGLSLLIVLALVVGHSILHPVAQLREAAQKLSRKNFSHRVNLRNSQDELGQLGKAFNRAASVLQRLYGELEKRSTHDGLTGALNRAEFERQLINEYETARRHERPLSLLMIDIDFFKQVNDTHGHQAGDIVLQQFVKHLEESIRAGDIVARYGGEEFAMILPDTDAEAAASMAERFRSSTQDLRIDCGTDTMLAITVSIGCTALQPDPMDAQDMVKVADVALYRAKRGGRNRVVSASDSEDPDGSDQLTTAA